MLSIKRDKNHILFGGTKVLQHTADKVDTSPEQSYLSVSNSVADMFVFVVCKSSST
jgi:hypothetical protein